jgi:serine/threonine protein kinase
VIADRYVLEREIGRGGMGAVWLARDTVLHRPVAVKRIGGLRGEVADTDLARILREARLAAAMHHPNVVPVFDLVDDAGEHWLVMEYVDGSTLTAMVRERGPLSPDQTATILRQLAGALQAAHRTGIVHRDVKPSNVLVTRDGQVKLTDFGIARSHGDVTLTTTGLLVGSPAYLAPEVVSGATATPTSDVWSLGATAYFALVGKPAYDTEANVIGTLYRIVHEEPPRPDQAGWLAPLLAGTMTPDPEQRWSLEQVLRFLEQGPPSAAPPDPGPQATARLTGLADPSPTREVTPAPPPAAPPAPPPVPLAAAPPAPPAPADAPPPSPRPPTRTATPGRPGRRRALAVVAVVLAVALVAAAVWALTRDGSGDQQQRTPAAPTSSQTSSSPTASPSATAEGMTAFVTTYLDTVTSDPAAGWEMLTEDFQKQSGSFAKYRTAWRSRPNAQVSNISADPDTMTVSYDVSYSDADGNPLFDDHVTLRLDYTDGVYRIAGES